MHIQQLRLPFAVNHALFLRHDFFGFFLTKTGTFGAIQNISAGDISVAAAHQRQFHLVLNFFYVKSAGQGLTMQQGFFHF